MSVQAEMGPVSGRSAVRRLNRLEGKVRRWTEFENNDQKVAAEALDTTLAHQRRIYLEGKGFLVTENARRALTNEPLIDRVTTKLLLRRHETPEILIGNRPLGLRPTEYSAAEEQARLTLIESLGNPVCRQQVELAAELATDLQGSVEGRFIQAMTAIDHLGFALRVRQTAVYGVDWRYREPHLLVWDTLQNNLPKLLSAIKEFPSLKGWIIQHSTTLTTALAEFHSNQQLSEILIDQMHRLSPQRQYPAASALVEKMQACKNQIEQIQAEANGSTVGLETEAAFTTFHWELRSFLRNTLFSPEAHELRRFNKYTNDPTIPFRYEGRLDNHTAGTSLRVRMLGRAEQQQRQISHEQSTKIDFSLVNFVGVVHDLGELGIEDGEDRVLGTKSQADRIAEEQRFKAFAADVKDPTLRAKLLIAQEIASHPERSAEGRFWKASEHLASIEIARRLDAQSRGDTRTDEEFTAQSGVFVMPSFADANPDGTVLAPTTKGARALTIDLVVNAYRAVIEAAGEFAVMKQYLGRHSTELRRIVNDYLRDPATNDQLLEEISQLKPYSEVTRAGQKVKRKECLTELIQYLDNLDSSSLDEVMRTNVEYVELVDGESIELVG